MFDKVLVANRGEIAVRVMKTCQRLGIQTVAVFSDADATAMHVAEADEAVRVGGAAVKDSYLSIDALVDAARMTGATAIHPGYGLVSESAAFARAVGAAGIVFVGPSPDVLDAFGDKIRARSVARAAGVAPPPGSEVVAPDDLEQLAAEARRVGFPVLIKAAGGGGGIGMQLVQAEEGLATAARSCADRGRAAFGDDRIYLERYLESPRHIEVQIVRDAEGRCVALGERECSVQRRHQKVVEESPSPASFFTGSEGEARRGALHQAAVDVVSSVGYTGAGTVEFVANADGEFFFLEVNARLQVEHPVTELVTGVDLVEEQLRTAAGDPLSARTLAAESRGHAVEARLYAEDPDKRFMPQPGHIESLRWPAPTEGVRIDTGVRAGDDVTPYYDPMIAKLVAHGRTRVEAIERLDRALAETEIDLRGPKGPKATNLAFLRRVLASEAFRGGDYDTRLVETLTA